MALSDRQRAVLALEGSWWQHGRTKEEAIRSVLGMSPTRYYELLAVLVDDRDALTADPLVVRRVRRSRDRRRRGGVGGVAAVPPVR